MNKLEKLRVLVEELYKTGGRNADAWIVWGYPNHVLFVAEQAERIAKEYDADADLAVAGALVHDIADAVMPRSTPNHMEESLRIAGELLRQAGFSGSDTTFILEEIVRPHSCRELLPSVLEGKVLATADAIAHFVTDFYPYFSWMHFGGRDHKEFAEYVLNRIDKAFNKKIFFEEIREEVRPQYEAIKLVFGLSIKE